MKKNDMSMPKKIALSLPTVVLCPVLLMLGIIIVYLQVNEIYVDSDSDSELVSTRAKMLLQASRRMADLGD